MKLKKNPRLVKFRDEIRKLYDKHDKILEKAADIKSEIKIKMSEYRRRLEKNPWHLKRSLIQRIRLKKIKLDSLKTAPNSSPERIQYYEDLILEMQTNLDRILRAEIASKIDSILK